MVMRRRIVGGMFILSVTMPMAVTGVMMMVVGLLRFRWNAA